MFTSVDQSFSRLSYGSKPFKSLFFKIPIPGVGIQLINILRLVFFLSMMACKPLTHTRTTPLAQASFPKWRKRKESIVTLRHRSEPIAQHCSSPPPMFSAAPIVSIFLMDALPLKSAVALTGVVLHPFSFCFVRAPESCSDLLFADGRLGPGIFTSDLRKRKM